MLIEAGARDEPCPEAAVIVPVRPRSMQVLQVPPRGVPELCAAAAKGDLDVVRELLRVGADPRATRVRPPARHDCRLQPAGLALRAIAHCSRLTTVV